MHDFRLEEEEAHFGLRKWLEGIEEGIENGVAAVVKRTIDDGEEGEIGTRKFGWVFVLSFSAAAAARMRNQGRKVDWSGFSET